MYARCLFAVLAASFSLYAEEVQVPFDTTGTVLTITAELEARLQLFPEYPYFVEAKLFAGGDSAYTLEVIHGEDFKVVRKTVPLSTVEAAELRRKVNTRFHGLPSAPGPPIEEQAEKPRQPSGRNKLLIGQTVAGLVFYDWAIPVALDAKDEDAAAAYWLLAGANYLVPMLLTDKTTVSRGAATMFLYGSTRGPFHGWALWELTNADRRMVEDGYHHDNDDNDDDDRHALGLAALVGLVEATSFYGWAATTEMSDGRAASIGVGGDFGAGCGLAAAMLINESNDHQSDEKDHNTVATGALIGSAVGMTLFSNLASRYDYTRGDAYMIRAAGYLGAGLPLAVLATAESESRQSYAAAGIAGTAIGLYAGHRLINIHHADKEEAQIALVATIAGAMAGTGFGMLASDGESGSIFVGTAIGGLAGFLIATEWHRKKPERSSINHSICPAAIRNGTVTVPGAHLNLSW